MSAGVDSAVVAKAAFLALGDRAVAITGVSASLATGELDEARDIARRIGIRHESLDTQEFASPAYVQNAPDRCYHCKTELYTQMRGLSDRLGLAVIANGANADDAGDYRPGMTAAGEHGVRSPLLEVGITKAQVRSLAAEWDLPVWDKPASPCLSSRVAYGEAVTPERLAMIDRAEAWLREEGLSVVRVRYHSGDLARVEVPREAIAALASDAIRERFVAYLKSLGFKFITLDLEGFRSGSQNLVLPILDSL
ncbi:MAG: ATP-dependent sacrificial sulfur transferase LarE [Planctomycetota bacterium]|nr:MAG: ATP-dependent sacrificial sulfur transferase LarE [Planctomycetota bacterium]